MPDHARKPFAGVRILDFTQVFAGPFGCYQLALLGADVIKIERRGGEDMRRSPLNREWAARNMATAWMAINSNRRNIALDLTRPKAIEIVHRLVTRADVVMENFRPGIMDKLGLGYAALSAINPRLIYCAVSGFGQNGPERTTAAYDGKIQAMSGIMSITGHPESGPTRAGFAVCDAIGGMTAAFAVSSALYQRTHTGRGQLVDVAMLDATLSFLSSFVTDYTIGGHLQGQSGNRAQSRLPTADVFKVKGGHILLAVNNEKQFGALARAIGKPDLAKDPRFVDWPARVANDKALRAVIEEVFASDDAKTWEARLTAADVPCSRVWSIAEIVEHPQLAHRDVLQRVKTRYGEHTFVGSGFRLAHGGGSIEREPALPGEHAEEILEEAGYGQDDIAALRAEGVI
ncbi:MAG TPA: CoA transferase [Hyphomicrobiaceae bacterium]|nr:CoA transferase [Hyphomicrobiaceae bacterium]